MQYSLKHLRESFRSDGQKHLAKCFVLFGGGMCFWPKNKCSLISTETVKSLPCGIFKQKNDSKLSKIVAKHTKYFYESFFSQESEVNYMHCSIPKYLVLFLTKMLIKPLSFHHSWMAVSFHPSWYKMSWHQLFTSSIFLSRKTEMHLIWSELFGDYKTPATTKSGAYLWKKKKYIKKTLDRLFLIIISSRFERWYI